MGSIDNILSLVATKRVENELLQLSRSNREDNHVTN